ncbi:hypothetical protein [Rhodococcoides fascians]|uniref:hypothetical protein n=1 Tax=Rhodococcoides fascians TaxID=1828 RepID=UPI0005632FEA|nr:MULTISPECIES: hypothetical protein [Rhodococcus]OZE96584.1 hypothetical protein CH301_19130 [Rhodococcus sp. 15-1189-1-1a]OZF11632.1 hypothetical protein CH299_19660 [Rhodococcus sp. 14-2686-1-2]
MSIDTHIDGDPESVRQLSRWLREQLAPVLDDAEDKVFAARNRIDGAWDGPASDAAMPKVTRAAEGAEKIAVAARDYAQQIDNFAAGLQKAQSMMADARRNAAAAGLTISSGAIDDPLSGDLSAAYGQATRAAEESRSVEREAAEALVGVWTNPYVDWFFLATEVVDAAAMSVVDVQTWAMNGKSAWLTAESRRYIDLAMNAQEGTPASVIYRDIDYANTTAARAVDVAEAAEDLGTKAGRVSSRLGSGLAVAGVAWDIYNGKPADQAIVSAGASFGASVAAGAAIGTLIPAPVIGTLAGAAVGAVAGIYTSGAVDTLYAEGFGSAGDAVVDGWDALYDTGASIGELATGAWDVFF